MPQAKYRLIFTQRRVLPLAVLVALGGAVVDPGAVGARGVRSPSLCWRWWRPGCRDAHGRRWCSTTEGYAVEEHGREKLRVPWREVVKVRADGAEQALYIDVGDPSRNLLVPPRRGYGFRFDRADELFQHVLALRAAGKSGSGGAARPKPEPKK